MAFEYESKTPQDVLVYTDSPIFHKRTVILDLAADVTCGDVIKLASVPTSLLRCRTLSRC